MAKAAFLEHLSAATNSVQPVDQRNRIALGPHSQGCGDTAKTSPNYQNITLLPG
jgi:hypothetical protein